MWWEPLIFYQGCFTVWFTNIFNKATCCLKLFRILSTSYQYGRVALLMRKWHPIEFCTNLWLYSYNTRGMLTTLILIGCQLSSFYSSRSTLYFVHPALCPGSWSERTTLCGGGSLPSGLGKDVEVRVIINLDWSRQGHLRLAMPFDKRLLFVLR